MCDPNYTPNKSKSKPELILARVHQLVSSACDYRFDARVMYQILWDVKSGIVSPEKISDTYIGKRLGKTRQLVGQKYSGLSPLPVIQENDN